MPVADVGSESSKDDVKSGGILEQETRTGSIGLGLCLS